MHGATLGTQRALSTVLAIIMTHCDFYRVKTFVKINIAWERTKKNENSPCVRVLFVLTSWFFLLYNFALML